MNTNHDWEQWGSEDPYYGVLTQERFRKHALTQEDVRAFFLTGENHIAAVFGTIHRVFDRDFHPRKALDFGCGVGRLLRPLSTRCDEVIGVDVASSMLAQAQRHCGDLSNCHLILIKDGLPDEIKDFDLVHSFIVFQHIPPQRGFAILADLLERVMPGGMVVLQLIYHCNANPIKRFLVRLRYRFAMINALRNLLRGVALAEPPMHMHPYRFDQVLYRLHVAGFLEIYQELDTWAQGDFEITTLFARKATPAPST